MREIKFRGKRVDGNNNWVYGSLVSGGKETYIISSYRSGYNLTLEPVCHVVDPETVGQYTGMKDKNGVEIYEVDIIKIPDSWDDFGMLAGEIYQVYFRYGGFRLKPKRQQNAKGYWLEEDETFEVIGNIHENTELLEEK